MNYNQQEALGRHASSFGNILVSHEDAVMLEEWGIAGTPIAVFPEGMKIDWDALPCLDISVPKCAREIFGVIYER